jgi:hypothetical protein
LLTSLYVSAQTVTTPPNLPPIQQTDPAPSSPVVARTDVQVRAKYSKDAPAISKHTVDAADVLSSAGTFGDFEKYLSTLPGVVFNSDESDDVLVRGGNPLENLYLVDGFEVPDINHITGLGTTGGFSSMIDTASVARIDLLSGGYSADYSERLSSVIAITTLGQPALPATPSAADQSQPASEAEAGYVGIGGHTTLHFRPGAQLLLSVHRSILNLVTDNIGLDGVPVFTNGLASGEFTLGPYDTLNLLSLTGSDSINVTPSNTNVLESTTIQTQYSGWRTTNGVRWMHAFDFATTGLLTLSDSESAEQIQQQNQDLLESQRFSTNPAQTPLTSIYSQQTHDGMSIVQYQFLRNTGSRFSLDSGVQGRLDRIHYTIAQPVGQQSPYSTSTAFQDTDSFHPNFMAGQNGTWLELSAHPSNSLRLTLGGRLQYFATGGRHVTVTPRARISYRLGQHHSVYAAFGQYAQQPPFIYLESYTQNKSLLPIVDQQLVVGSELYKGHGALFTLEAYRKHYWHYPVSTEYPEVSLANLVDTLGQQYVWLPFASHGDGHDYGVELSGEARLGRQLYLQGNLAYARAQYSGEDHVFRPGNFDFPVVLNSMFIWRAKHHYEASLRYEFTSGRPYTPYLLAPSIAQDRGIYNTQRINANRGPAYSRLDLQFARTFHPFHTNLYTFGGLENALDRNNFLGNAWLPHCANSQHCIETNGAYTTVSQIGLYPNFGVRAYF